MKKTTLILVMAMLCLNFSLKAQQPTFTGTIKLPHNIKSRNDSLLINYKKPYTPAGSGFEGIYLLSDSNGYFNFKLPAYKEPYIMQILICHNNNGKRAYVRLSESYFVESSDHIKIELTKNTNGKADSVTFYGTGSEKYNLTNELNQLFEDYRNAIIGLRKYQSPNFSSYLNQTVLVAKEFETKKKMLIAQSGLSSDMQKMVSYEHGRISSEWKRLMAAFFRTAKGNLPRRAVIKAAFNQHQQKFTYQTDQLMKLCPIYLADLALNESKAMFINAPADSIPLRSFINLIKQKYTDTLAEPLLSNFFIGGNGYIGQIKFNTTTYDSLLRNVSKIIMHPVIKPYMDGLLKTLAGTPLYNTNFTDINGKTINTAAMIGKVVLIDMWNVGCTWCTVFHKKFHKDVYPLLKDNKDFVYLSIGTDIKSTRWKQGMDSGLYTSPEYLNVNTNGKGLNHPFAKHYNVQALPFALLIDKSGKIFSSNIIGPESAYTLIKAALNQPAMNVSSQN